MSGVRVLVGTRKGAFVLSSDGQRDLQGWHEGRQADRASRRQGQLGVTRAHVNSLRARSAR